MSERTWGQIGLFTGSTGIDDLSLVPIGRHAVDEEAALTPIFHALSRGGWRNRQDSPSDAAAALAGVVAAADPYHAPDPLESFRRDPLGAPLPASGALAAVPTTSSDASTPAITDQPYVGRRRRADVHTLPDVRRAGRHHRHLVPVDGGAAG